MDYLAGKKGIAAIGLCVDSRDRIGLFRRVDAAELKARDATRRLAEAEGEWSPHGRIDCRRMSTLIRNEKKRLCENHFEPGQRRRVDWEKTDAMSGDL